MVNVFRKILAEKLGIPIDKLPKEKGQVVETKLGRLKYKGAMYNWGFAVFKYSREFYDPDEFMFPGAEALNGTIEGALNAGKQLYP